MKTIVIGAGAAGLTAAIYAARQGDEVTVIEHMEKPGRKILVTGNGKCNITNMNLSPDNYYGDKEFVSNVLNNYTSKDTLSFFNNLGLMTINKNGYIYPMSQQASSVLKFLKETAYSLGIKFKYNNSVHKIDILEDSFVLHIGIPLECEKLIIATGGLSYPKTGSDGSSYKLIRSLGHEIIEPEPALTSLVCRKLPLHKASGVRTNSTIKLVRNNETLSVQSGELQLTEYGISGIPVFNLSRAAQKNDSIYIDFLPDYDADTLKNILTSLCSSHKSLSCVLNGLINDKLGKVIIEKADLEPKGYADELEESNIEQLITLLKNFKVTVYSKKGYDFAQVTMGGVDTCQINPDTMESTIVKNLYFAGEVINVDGICGGYNLQWAWSTGAIAGGFEK